LEVKNSIYEVSDPNSKPSSTRQKHPISLDQILSLVKESLLAETPETDASEMKSRIRATLEELIAEYAGAGHGIENPPMSPADTACPPSPTNMT